jgi:hypothetical protein
MFPITFYKVVEAPPFITSKVILKRDYGVHMESYLIFKRIHEIFAILKCVLEKCTFVELCPIF